MSSFSKASYLVETAWRWFFRCVVGIGIVFVGLFILLAFGMTRPNINQSDGYTAVTPEAIAATISRSFASSATQVGWCRVGVGMGGHLLIYRFCAPLTDMDDHAQREFATHQERPKVKQQHSVQSPITEADLKSYKSIFGVEADWMIAPSDAKGAIYESADGQNSHRPIIFIDETNGVLYFQLTD